MLSSSVAILLDSVINFDIIHCHCIHNYKTKVDDNFEHLPVSIVALPVCMCATKIQLGLLRACVRASMCCVGCWKKALDSVHNEIML